MRNDPQSWDARYAGTDHVWSAEPNALAAELVADLPPGRALDLAAGEGRMALWLAARGWTVTALDFSAVGLAKGQARAEQDGLDYGGRSPTPPPPTSASAPSTWSSCSTCTCPAPTCPAS